MSQEDPSVPSVQGISSESTDSFSGILVWISLPGALV